MRDGVQNRSREAVYKRTQGTMPELSKYMRRMADRLEQRRKSYVESHAFKTGSRGVKAPGSRKTRRN